MRSCLRRALTAAALAWGALAALALWLALNTPALGLKLSAPADGSPGLHIAAVTAERAAGPAAGSRLLALGAPGEPAMALLSTDLREDPDQFETHTEIRAFYERQGRLHTLLQQPQLRLHWQAADGSLHESDLRPAPRPASALPGVFWLQLLVSGLALLSAVAVRGLRPRGEATAWFAATGVALSLSAWASALYGGRELALDPVLFRGLSALNLLAAMGFGVALTGLFLRFPRPLGPRRLPLVVALAALVPALADTLQLVDALDWSRRLPMAALLLAAIAAAVAQWRAARSDPLARSTLRWFAVSTLSGCALFIGAVMLPPVFGLPALVSQGHAFGFFLLIHGGLALGVARSSLFDLDRWALQVGFWALSGAALVALDLLLLTALRVEAGLSLAVSALVVAVAWQPLRAWLQARLVARRPLPEHELLQGVLDLTLAHTPADGVARWQALLQRLYAPLELRAATAADTGGRPLDTPQLADEGLALLLPAVADAPALRLACPWSGRGLFGAADLRTADRLLALVQRARQDREAYDRGVEATRLRIAQDLHDDVGARLLGVLHEHDGERARQAVRTVLADMRGIVGALGGRAPDWHEAVAEWRSEAAGRLDAAGLELHWPLHEDPPLRLDAEQHRHLSSILRELLSNVLRHAGARRVEIDARHDSHTLRLRVQDDGSGFDPAQQRAGHGLANLARRAEQLGAVLHWQGPPGTALEIRLPLQPSGQALERTEPALSTRVPT